MKKLCTLMCLILASFGFAQEDPENFTIEKGQWTLEGNFAINAIQRDSERNNSSQNNFNFSIGPQVGYAVADNLLVGLGISYSYSKSEVDFAVTNQTSEANSLGFTPYVKTFFPLSSNFALSLQGELRYAFGKETNETNSSSNEFNTDFFFAGLRPGINYFVSEQLFLSANFGTFGYEYSKNEDDTTIVNESNAFRLNLSTSSLLFGINFVF